MTQSRNIACYFIPFFIFLFEKPSFLLDIQFGEGMNERTIIIIFTICIIDYKRKRNYRLFNRQPRRPQERRSALRARYHRTVIKSCLKPTGSLNIAASILPTFRPTIPTSTRSMEMITRKDDGGRRKQRNEPFIRNRNHLGLTLIRKKEDTTPKAK